MTDNKDILNPAPSTREPIDFTQFTDIISSTLTLPGDCAQVFEQISALPEWDEPPRALVVHCLILTEHLEKWGYQPPRGDWRNQPKAWLSDFRDFLAKIECSPELPPNGWTMVLELLTRTQPIKH